MRLQHSRVAVLFYSFIHTFIHSFIHSSIHPSIHPSIHSFIHSFIYFLQTTFAQARTLSWSWVYRRIWTTRPSSRNQKRIKSERSTTQAVNSSKTTLNISGKSTYHPRWVPGIHVGKSGTCYPWFRDVQNHLCNNLCHLCNKLCHLCNNLCHLCNNLCHLCNNLCHLCNNLCHLCNNLCHLCDSGQRRGKVASVHVARVRVLQYIEYIDLNRVKWASITRAVNTVLKIHHTLQPYYTFRSMVNPLQGMMGTGGGRGRQRLGGMQVNSRECHSLYQDNTTLKRVLSSSTKSFKIKTFKRESGLHYVQLSITNPDHPNAIGFDYGFFDITLTSPQAFVEGGSHRVFIENTVITLNGSGSFDPNHFHGPGENVLIWLFPRCALLQLWTVLGPSIEPVPRLVWKCAQLTVSNMRIASTLNTYAISFNLFSSMQ